MPSINPINVSWSQHESRVYLHLNDFDFFFDAPKGFEIADVDDSLKSLCLHILFFKTPFEHQFQVTSPDQARSEQRARYDNIILSYSSGIDSGAALLMLPRDKTIPMYLKRDFSTNGSFRQIKNKNLRIRWNGLISKYFDHNAVTGIHRLSEAGEFVSPVIVPNDFELVANLFQDKDKIGFNWGSGYYSLLVLFADFFRSNAFANGTILEGLYLSHTYRFVDIQSEASAFVNWANKFRTASLSLMCPLAGLSEVITARIVSNSELSDVCSPCIVPASRNSIYCKVCAKCYRKRLICGERAFLNPQAALSQARYPYKPTASTLYAVKKGRKRGYLKRTYADIDLDFLERFYAPYLEHPVHPLVDRDIGGRILKFLISKGFQPMTQEDIDKLKTFGTQFNQKDHGKYHGKNYGRAVLWALLIAHVVLITVVTGCRVFLRKFDWKKGRPT